jgi:hypothetical protein
MIPETIREPLGLLFQTIHALSAVDKIAPARKGGRNRDLVRVVRWR